MLGGQPNHGWQLCFPLKLHAGGSDFRLYDSFNLRTYLLMRWKGPDALVVCQADQSLTVGFLLIQFYALSSPYLCFISFLYLDLHVLGDDALIC